MEDADYLSLHIDLLTKEVKYSALLEINREYIQERCQERFVYPFEKFKQVLLDYDERKEKIEIDLSKNNLISAPWNHTRYKNSYKHLKREKFKYDPQNHTAIYYGYLNIACAYNGFHSLGIGTYMGEGKIMAEYYDVSRIFPYLQVNPDLSFSYNKENVERMLKEKRIHLNRWKDELETRIYGTDYRLLLIYTLCQKKFFLENKL